MRGSLKKSVKPGNRRQQGHDDGGANQPHRGARPEGVAASQICQVGDNPQRLDQEGNRDGISIGCRG